MIPTRRRRFAPLLAIVVTIGAFSLSGCGGGSSSSPRNSGGGTPTTNNTSPGTYILNVTATAANGITHTSVVTLTVK
jgi:hypothetical protein